VRADAYISTARAEVRSGELARHVACRCDSGRAFAVSSGIGLPRTWHLTTSVVLDGFAEGLLQVRTRDMDGLTEAYEHARERLRKRCDELLEKMIPDASLTAVSIGPTDLDVLSVGPGRVYLHRSGQPQRLTPRDETETGVLRGTAAKCSVPIEPNDIVLIGSSTAFSVKSIAKLASVLEADPKTTPSVLASLLTEPAAAAGVGAAAIVFRIV
jgi:hypothetical protein